MKNRTIEKQNKFNIYKKDYTFVCIYNKKLEKILSQLKELRTRFVRQLKR